MSDTSAEKVKKTIARVLREEEYPAWNALVSQSPQGSVYSTSEYLQILSEVTGGSYRIFAVFRGDELRGGVGLFETKRGGGVRVENRLLLYYNGVVLKSHTSSYPSERSSRELETTRELASALKGLGYERVLLHNRGTLADIREFIQAGWRVSPSYTYVVNITKPEESYSRVEKNLRRLIERGNREGLTVTEDDDFDSFYRLHLLVSDRKDAPSYLPEAAFRRYFESLKALGMCRLYHARLPGGQAVASQLVLTGAHPVTHSVCAGADAEYLKIGSTPFLRWRVFEELSKLGYQANDLTDAALNSVTHFKSQLGGELQSNWVLETPESFRQQLGALPAKAFRRGKRLVKSILGK